MKFCPYCGASLSGSAVSFCPECGRELPSKKATPRPHRPTGRKPSRPHTGKKHRKQPVSVGPSRKAQTDPPHIKDDSYDGYYNDIAPVDAGQMGEPMDPELAKRITILISIAVGIIVLAAVFMSLL